MADLRAAQARDITAVLAIDPLGLRPGRAGEIRALIDEQASLVAVPDGEVVGFLAVRPGHFYQRDFIDLLFVAPAWRRQGAARALIRATLRNAATSRVFTSTNESNTPMRELLRSEGWTPSGVLTGLDKGDPEHVFFHDCAGSPWFAQHDVGQREGFQDERPEGAQRDPARRSGWAGPG